MCPVTLVAQFAQQNGLVQRIKGLDRFDDRGEHPSALHLAIAELMLRSFVNRSRDGRRDIEHDRKDGITH